MKRFVALILILTTTSCILVSHAQSTEQTLGYTKTSIFAQYGYAPINSFDYWANNTFNKNYPGTTHQTTTEGMSSFGTVSIGATFCLTKLIELCLPLTYSQGSGTLYDLEDLTSSCKFNDKWYSFTPNVKFNWYNSQSGSFRLYSRAGIGIALANRKTVTDHGVDLDNKPAFTYIASPIGMEIGKNICFYLEAGYGQTGIVNAGVRFRFRKTKEGYNSDGTVKKYNWTDRYMDRK